MAPGGQYDSEVLAGAILTHWVHTYLDCHFTAFSQSCHCSYLTLNSINYFITSFVFTQLDCPHVSWGLYEHSESAFVDIYICVNDFLEILSQCQSVKFYTDILLNALYESLSVRISVSSFRLCLKDQINILEFVQQWVIEQFNIIPIDRVIVKHPEQIISS